MEIEINFYQCDDKVALSIAPLALKIFNENKKAFIVAEDQAQVKEIDAGLWNYGKDKFIPHAICSDKDFDLKRQPIVISDKEENFNNADYLVLTKAVSESFIKGFSRVFYFYNSFDSSVAETLSQKYKAIAGKMNFYKKSNGVWSKS